jgi:hopene-associated glycosyltransferase HpnB
MVTLTVLALIAWIAVLVRPARPWSTHERLEPTVEAADLSRITVLIPARDEADVIQNTLAALDLQGTGLRIIVVDDRSRDGTGGRARTVDLSACELRVLEGAPRPPGWAGKLWALEQGLAEVKTPVVLLLDADITLARGVLATLLRKLTGRSLSLVSIMARLPSNGFWERLLVPAYVFFFKLLYPFALVNRPDSRVAAAAGGCMLIETGALRGVGGFAAIRGELIDDCALARRIKAAGYPIWLGLSDAVVSQRGYRGLKDFWSMVARSAFTELEYSILRLLACTAVMLLLFVVPPVALFGSLGAAAGGASSLMLMASSYLPMVSFYGLPVLWTLTLPVAALLFLAMTWSSAWGYWRGTRALWKNRVYGVVE